MGVGVATDHPHYQKAMNNCSVPAVHHFFPPLMHPSQHPPISCFPFLHFSSLRIFKHSHTINLPKHREKQPPVNFFQTFSHFRCSMNILGVALLGGGKTPDAFICRHLFLANIHGNLAEGDKNCAVVLRQMSLLFSGLDSWESEKIRLILV